MPNIVTELLIDRVDLVDEGANSAAFIEVFKRKEPSMELTEILSKLKPEHATVVQQSIDAANEELSKVREDNKALDEQLKKANEDLATANSEIEVLKAQDCACDGEADENGVCKACGRRKKKVEKGTGFDETEVLKAMPEAAREMFIKMRQQKEAAEELVRKAAEDKIEAEAVAKAATMKSLPIEQTKLVEILKSCNTDITELLAAASAAIDTVVLGEVGKSSTKPVDTDAWSKIEAKAEEIAKRDSVTKQKAVETAVKENPDLYRDYLNGGAN